MLSYQDIDGEGHDEARDEEVGHGEGDDEEVGDVLQELLPTHRQDDQYVPEDYNHAQLKSNQEFKKEFFDFFRVKFLICL